MQDIIEELTANINVLDASCRQVKKALSDAGFSSVEEALAEIEQLRLQLEAANSGEYAREIGRLMPEWQITEMVMYRKEENT